MTTSNYCGRQVTLIHRCFTSYNFSTKNYFWGDFNVKPNIDMLQKTIENEKNKKTIKDNLNPIKK